MKILLVNFHNHDVHSGMYGLVALASYIELYVNNVDIKVVDALREPFYDILVSWKPDIVALTSYTIWHDQVLEHAHKIKKLSPDSKIIIGGSHITGLPKGFVFPIDYAIIGEGEEALAAICNEIGRVKIGNIKIGAEHATIGNIKGVIAESINDPEHTTPVDVNILPVVRLDKYTPISSYQRQTVGMIASRGCYFSCKYCNIRTMSRTIRIYPIKRVVDEIQLYYDKLGARYIIFWDDVFGLNEKWTESLIEELDKRQLLGKIGYHIHVRASTVTEERCQIWKKLGVTGWNMGLDFGSDKMLKKVKGPDCSIEKTREAILMAGKYKFIVGASFIFGAPEETIDDMRETISFMSWIADMKERGLLNVHIWFFCATPLPNTEWWKIAESKGKVSWDMDYKRLSLHNWREHLLLNEGISSDQFNWIHEDAKKMMIRINGAFGEP